jgi:hypothetical protein
MHSQHILPLNSPKNFGTLKGIFFCKIYYNVVSVAAGEKTTLYKAILQETFMTKSASEYLFCKKN